MESVRGLRERIRTAEEVSSVVVAMRGLAAADLRRHQRVVGALGVYHRTVELGLQVVLRGPWSDLLEQFEQTPSGTEVALVFGTDQGFCGPLERDLVERALDWVERVESGAARLASIGARLTEELRDRGRSLLQTFSPPRSPEAVGTGVEDLLLAIEAWRAEEDIGRVVLIHARPRSDASYELVERQLLPLDLDHLRRIAHRDWPTRQLPTLADDRRRLLASLVRQQLFVSLYRALAESLAAENAARLAAMRSAEESVQERLDELRRAHHRERQRAITAELLDVTSGYEALREE